YGQFTGCAINVITKSGTNEYTASAFYEYSDDDLRGNRVAGRPVAAVQPEKRWGVTLGGPIIKDRLFIYGAYEHHEAGQSQDDGPTGAGYANQQNGISKAQFDEIRGVLNSVYGIDTGDLVYNREYTNDRYFVRADLQINDRHRLEATYQRLEETTVKPDDLFTGNSPQAIGANTFYKSGTISDYYSGRLYSQWTDQFSTELRYSRSEIQDLQDPIGGGEAQSGSPIPRIIVGIDNATGNDGAVLAGPGNSRSANDLRTTVEQYRAVAKLAAGNHNFKLGFELNKADLFNLFVQNATGTLVFRNIADLRAGLVSPGRPNAPACTSATTTTTPVNVINGCTYGAFGNFSSTGDITSAAAKFDRSIYSVYLQDEWRATDQLKITAGVRADWYDGGSPAFNPVFAQRYGFGNNNGFSKLEPTVLPRVGFTYDFDNEGLFSRSQLVGGVGIFSGGDPLVWFGNAFQNDGRGFATGNSNAADCTPFKDANGQISVVSGGRFTGVPTCIQANAIGLAAAGRGNTQSIDPDLKMPTVIRANLGFRTELNFTDSGFLSGWNANLDYIYSEFRNPYTLVDLAQTIDTRKGLNGYTIDGRPIYSAIDTLQPGCTARLVDPGSPPVYANVNPVCFTNTANRFDELMLTNSKGFRSHVASFLLSKNFEGGLIMENGSTWISFGYAYTNSHDRRNMYNSTAGSNYDQTAAFDRQNPDASPGFYQSKHNFTFATNFKNEFIEGLATSFGFTFVARSGRPYSLTWTGGGAFNNTNSGTDNALVYIPTGPTDPNVVYAPTLGTGGVVLRTAAQNAADLDSFISGLDCANKYRGRTVPRNGCTNDWYFDLDLTVSQELFGPGRLFGRQDKIKLYGMFDNFLNFIDPNWNVQRRRNFYGVQDIASLGTTSVGGVTSNVDAQGRYIINGFTGGSFDADNQINVSSSVWRFKIGVSYEF
ncbi:TonB-dependent receptor, partial [Sphingomonas sp.]|uniref:TonB-dependent receptor domain-containing protein n=1 Tax=Sphingomonas sp. TaxID=28214 RepID=UPI0031D98E9B